MHGLRYAYAQNRHEELTGWSCPTAGGPVTKDLTPEQREIDHEARLTFSRELGHEREAVTAIWVADRRERGQTMRHSAQLTIIIC